MSILNLRRLSNAARRGRKISDTMKLSEPKDARLHEACIIAADKLVLLSRNPQYLTPKQMQSLVASIERDGFLVPIVVRKIEKEQYEVVSGNHRMMAGKEAGMTEFPCVLIDVPDAHAKRIAVNLNTIHGDPPAELMAPFLADLSDDILRDIHFDYDFLKEIEKFDVELSTKLSALELPDAVNTSSPQSSIERCVCPKCHRSHFVPNDAL